MARVALSPDQISAAPFWFERRFVRNLIVGLAAFAASSAGLLQPVDRFLQDHRFAVLRRPPTGQVVVVEIDSSSLQSIGLWPWPRMLHAKLIDRLAAMGARQTLFDVDFSADSDPVNDAEFADALARAGGQVGLAVFEQPGPGDAGPLLDRPIKPFADHSRQVDIDVPTDSDGLVRDYWPDLPVGGARIPTLASAIAGARWPAGRPFGLDFGIDLNRMDQISAADVIAGTVDADRIRGKDVIIGATAEELRDFFRTPRYGMTPGAYLHALAAETLLQNRGLVDAPPALLAGLMALLVLGATRIGRRVNRVIAFALTPVAAMAIEGLALELQQVFVLRAATAALQAALAGFVLAALVAELRVRRRQYALAAREREIVREMLARVVADHFDGVVIVDAHGKIIAASRMATDLVGQPLEGRTDLDLLPHELSWPLARAIAGEAGASDPSALSGEVQVASQVHVGDASGRRRWLEFVITVSAVGERSERAVACLTFRDVTERREHEARLAYLAGHDELTGAWSRRRLIEHLREFIIGAGPQKRGLTLFSLDLRRFAMVNDVFGYEAGDIVLNAVVTRLRANKFVMISRLGGDNFAFVRPGESDGEQLKALGRSVIALLGQPYDLDERRIVVGASLGATTTAISGFDPDTLLMHASMARDSAKRKSGDAFAAFLHDMEGERREKQQIDAALRLAISDGSLNLQYQPKVELATGRLTGAEALMRWQDSDGAAVSPARFIPIAEESSLIVDLGRWALETACEEAAAWPDSTKVAVNVSPVQFSLSDVFADVQRALARSGLPAGRLEIEITESAFADPESGVSSTLQKLRNLGVSVAIDDFGTGYSSLHYFGRLPFDTVKIDQSFVRRLNIDPSAVATVRAIASLAHAHGKHLVAEGVEDAEQAGLLNLIGCESVQGYLYGRPGDAASLRERCERENLPARKSEAEYRAA